MRSIAGAPSRTASRCASLVNAPVVIEQSLVGATDHRSPEIADFPRPDRARIPLALEPDRCVREERPTDISQCCEAGRMTLGYLRVCASQRRSRRKTLHFNLLRNPRPTTTLAGRVVLPVSTGVAEFERPLIALRTEEGRRTARAPDIPFDRRPELRPDQRTLAR